MFRLFKNKLYRRSLSKFYIFLCEIISLTLMIRLETIFHLIPSEWSSRVLMITLIVN